MATNKPRIPVTFEPELFAQVTAYRLQYGISTQSKAVRQLVRLGLESLEKEGRGVPVSEPRDSQERELVEIARELEPAQKALLLRVLELAGRSEETRRTQ